MVNMMVLFLLPDLRRTARDSRRRPGANPHDGAHRSPDYRQMDPLICNLRAVFERHSFRYSPK
jgi:hypothetical protein